MQRKTSSIGEIEACRVYCIYNREDGIFEIVDTMNRSIGGSNPLASFDEFIEPRSKTWASRVRAATDWLFSDILAGFVSCAVSMNPHLFTMMPRFDDHIKTSKKDDERKSR